LPQSCPGDQFESAIASPPEKRARSVATVVGSSGALTRLVWQPRRAVAAPGAVSSPPVFVLARTGLELDLTSLRHRLLHLLLFGLQHPHTEILELVGGEDLRK